MNIHKNITICQRVTLIRKTTCLFFMIGILMSWTLWTSERFFPVIPLTDLIPEMTHPADIVLLLLTLIIFGFNTLVYRQKLLLVLFLLLLLLLLQDQMRWQPWVYLYFLIVLPFTQGNWNKNHEGLITYFQIILIGIYVWSGLHKLNPNFISFTFNGILTGLLNIKEVTTIDTLSPAGYLIPITEIFIGLCLAIPKFRNAGVYFALLTHVFILIYLSPIGINYNTIVYPWNIAIMIIVFLTFYDNKQKLVVWPKGKIAVQILHGAAVLFIWILPVMNVFNKWDHYLSFSLYSGKPNSFYIAVEENGLKKITHNFDPYFVKIDGMTGGEIIDVDKWSMGELHVPFYPQTRVFKKLGKTFCNYGIADDQLIFLEFENPLNKMAFSSFQCKDL